MNMYPSQIKNTVAESRYIADSFLSSRSQNLDSMILKEKLRSNEMQERKKSKMLRLVQLQDQFPQHSIKSKNTGYLPSRTPTDTTQDTFRDDNDMDVERDLTLKSKTHFRRRILKKL